MKALKNMAMTGTLGIGLITGQSALAALYDFSNAGSGTVYTGGGSGPTQIIPDNTPAGSVTRIV